MSSEHRSGTPSESNGNGDGTEPAADSVANKLSEELDKWKRRRTTSLPQRPELPSSSSSEPARTIKVKGHETLVIRKPKLAKPAANPAPEQD